MYPLFESIRIEDGRWCNMSYHYHRMRQAQLRLFGSYGHYSIEQSIIPQQYRKGIVKCRVDYGQNLGPMQFSHYLPKPINSLKLVQVDGLDYQLKYADRAQLQALYGQRGECDDVVICRNGLLTDTSYSNLVFYNGSKWLTPAYPLLRGTQRARLLELGLIHEAVIYQTDLHNYQQVMLVNALLGFDTQRTLPISGIII